MSASAPACRCFEKTHDACLDRRLNEQQSSGEITGRKLVAKEVLNRAGVAFVAGKDDVARLLRELAFDIEADIERAQAAHDKEWP